MSPTAPTRSQNLPKCPQHVPITSPPNVKNQFFYSSLLGEGFDAFELKSGFYAKNYASMWSPNSRIRDRARCPEILIVASCFSILCKILWFEGPRGLERTCNFHPVIVSCQNSFMVLSYHQTAKQLTSIIFTISKVWVWTLQCKGSSNIFPHPFCEVLFFIP